MLNVIALRPAEKNQPKGETSKPTAKALRHHVLKEVIEEESGRLSCNDEDEIEVPPMEIYAAR